VPKHIADLFERRARANHLRRQTVAQHVRSHIGRRRLHARGRERILEDVVDDLTILERAVGRTQRYEQGARSRRYAVLP
jgi:hypothetical protein